MVSITTHTLHLIMVKMIISKEGNILEHRSASFHHFLILLLEKMFLQKHSERNLRRY